MENGIDISRWQGDFNAEKAKSAGIDTVFIRAYYGTSKDSKFIENAEKCRKARLPFGAYQFITWHFLSENNGSESVARVAMIDQTAALANILKDQGVTSWVAIDQEMEKGENLGIDTQTNTKLLNESADLLRKHGYNPCLYASASWLENHVDANGINMPIWCAYYYNDPQDADFDGCADIYSLSGHHAAFIKSLRDNMCMWQYGRIGYGKKYGAQSENVDRNIIYFQPKEKNNMTFYEETGKRLVVTSAERPTCQIFKTPDANDWLGNLPFETVLPVIGVGDVEMIGSTRGRWYKVTYKASENGEAYVWVAPDRCRIEQVPQSSAKKEIAIKLREIADILEELK